MESKLIFNKHTENLIEIAMVFAAMKGESEYLFEKLTDIDSIIWSQLFVKLANEFESIYEDADWGGEDTAFKEYLEAIEEYAREKILSQIESEDE